MDFSQHTGFLCTEVNCRIGFTLCEIFFTLKLYLTFVLYHLPAFPYHLPHCFHLLYNTTVVTSEYITHEASATLMQKHFKLQVVSCDIWMAAVITMTTDTILCYR